MLGRTIFILLFLIAGAYLGQLILDDPGYVFITIKETTLETSLWLALLLLAASMLGLWLIYKVVIIGIFSPANLRQSLSQIRFKKNHLRLKSSVLDLVVGDYDKIYKTSKNIFGGASNSGLESQIVLAAAALKRGKNDETLKLCQAVRKQLGEVNADNPSGAVYSKTEERQAEQACEILMAKAYAAKGEPAKALKLIEKYAADATAFSTLRDLYLQDKRWNSLAQHLTNCDLSNANNLAAIMKLNEQCQELNQISNLWHSLPSKARNKPDMLTSYTRALIRNEDSETALNLLQKALKKKYLPELVDIYKKVKPDKPLLQLKFLEDLRGQSPDKSSDESLLAALAEVSDNNDMREKSLGYYEELMQSFPNTAKDNKAKYASLLEKSNLGQEKSKANAIYKAISVPD